MTLESRRAYLSIMQSGIASRARQIVRHCSMRSVRPANTSANMRSFCFLRAGNTEQHPRNRRSVRADVRAVTMTHGFSPFSRIVESGESSVQEATVDDDSPPLALPQAGRRGRTAGRHPCLARKYLAGNDGSPACAGAAWARQAWPRNDQARSHSAHPDPDQRSESRGKSSGVLRV